MDAIEALHEWKKGGRVETMMSSLNTNPVMIKCLLRV